MGKTIRFPPRPGQFKPAPRLPDFESGSVNAGVRIESIGGKALMETLLELPILAKDAAGYELEAIAAEVITDAKENDYVPFKLGNLRSSGDSDQYEPNKSNNLEIYMWFGGIVNAEGLALGLVDASEYAEVQHEDMTFHHPMGGGPKYLERPFDKVSGTIIPRVAAAVGNVLGFNQQFTQFALTPEEGVTPPTAEFKK